MKRSVLRRDREQSAIQLQPDSARTKEKPRSGRESIESFVVVFVAFLVWSLEAEGFVIPTGSMATTLLGRHKEITCPECGIIYTVNADREVESSGNGKSTGVRVEFGTCVNCRFETQVGEEPSFSGDRVYVMKQGASMPLPGTPRAAIKRWDVTVFKLPEEPEVRYIKRVVGMPNEVIRIEGGDLWGRPLESLDFPSGCGERRTTSRRCRRSFMTTSIAQLRSWAIHVGCAGGPRTEGGWIERGTGRFATGTTSDHWSELRYHNIVPSPDDWKAIQANRHLPRSPRATLITDFNSYNTDVIPKQDRMSPRRAARPWFQPHWVGDLTLSLRLTVREASGSVRLELVEGGISNRCEIDLATGQASLLHDDKALGEPALTELKRPGTYALSFANVDDRLTLWVDSKLPFGDGRDYESNRPAVAATDADLEPACVGALRAAVEVDGLVLKRDVYYTLEPAECDYLNFDAAAQIDSKAFFELLSDPSRFSELEHHPARDYVLGPGRYLMLGDNSPWSRDARAWGQSDRFDPEYPQMGWDMSGRSSWEVPESLLIGKAFCVYWPHAKPIWPKIRLGTDFRLPILPYIERMRFIR